VNLSLAKVTSRRRTCSLAHRMGWGEGRTPRWTNTPCPGIHVYHLADERMRALANEWFGRNSAIAEFRTSGLKSAILSPELVTICRTICHQNPEVRTGAAANLSTTHPELEPVSVYGLWPDRQSPHDIAPGSVQTPMRGQGRPRPCVSAEPVWRAALLSSDVSGCIGPYSIG
jgi:hypothetical protein